VTSDNELALAQEALEDVARDPGDVFINEDASRPGNGTNGEHASTMGGFMEDNVRTAVINVQASREQGRVPW